MILFDVYDLVFMTILHTIQLLIVDLLYSLSSLLAVYVFSLNFDHVGLELSQKLINRFLVLSLDVCDSLFVMLLHL